MKSLKERYGDWALVTGASSGIGRQFAIELAAQGFNLLITARRNELLEELAAGLRSRNKVLVQIIAGDIAQPEIPEQILHISRDLGVGLAILNAGFGSSGNFLHGDEETELKMLQVNCAAMFRLTYGFARLFAAKRCGAMVLMSSMVAFQGVPYAAHYAATKAYVQSLGEGIAVELKPHGVDVLIASPGPVNTGFAETASMRMGKALRPEDFVPEILRAIGKKRTILPGTLSKLLVGALRTVPRSMKVQIMKLVMGGMTKHNRISTSITDVK